MTQPPVRDVPKRDQAPTCSVPFPYRGTFKRIWYGVGTDQVCSKSGFVPFRYKEETGNPANGLLKKNSTLNDT